MSYSFWDTAGGQRFAQYTIPALTEAINRANEPLQKTETISKDSKFVEAAIQRYAEKGFYVHSSIDCGNDIVLIFEKK